MIVDRLLSDIQRGKDGKNVGISMGLPELDKILFGIQRECLYTIGADTSGGKTSYALDIFVYNMLKNKGDKKVKILFYSFEMSKESLFAKLLSRYIWDNFGEVITYEDILSLTKPITDAQLAIVNQCVPWMRSVESILTIYDKSLTPAGIYATCKKWLETSGTFVKVDEHREDYIEKDKSEIRLVIADHMGLIGGTGSKKERIDTVVDMFIYFRNKCFITGVMVQQLNRNQKSMDRKLNGYEQVQIDDFADTSGTTNGSNVVLALYYPYREKIARCDGYPIQNVLKNKFRLIQVLKNRFGRADVAKGAAFYGEIGMFRELPRPEEITNYEEYLNLSMLKPLTDNVINELNTDTIDEETDDLNEDFFKF